MKLNHKLDKIMFLGIVFMLAFIFGVTIAKNMSVNTYAENENGIYEETEDHFVTFYDDGKKLTVKTTAKTVKEALDKAGYKISTSDKVEPALDTKIDRDNFFLFTEEIILNRLLDYVIRLTLCNFKFLL